ncbi:hypothetical protein [Occultella kanbiaonis]|uniref:hypothetical protein n=1 Tax=Occultella kanbiaonis TaxID=2675754 RepID=UPI00143DFDB4|nr:hypothetical protein [Occultella kanbiaonis]
MIIDERSIRGLDRRTGTDQWSVPALAPRCTDDAVRLTCVTGQGDDAQVLLIDPLSGEVGAAGVPGVEHAVAAGADLVLIRTVAAGYEVARFDGAARALVDEQPRSWGLTTGVKARRSSPAWEQRTLLAHRSGTPPSHQEYRNGSRASRSSTRKC